MHSAKRNTARDFIDAPPREQTELRLSLMRKIMPFVKTWRKCPAGACRRHRRCASSALECAKLPQRRISAENEQVALANIQRALARRRAEINDSRNVRA